MFSNFIYFIVVLLIYTTYQPTETPRFGPFYTLISFLLLTAIFVSQTVQAFQGLARRMGSESFYRMDHRFNRTVTRQSIIAIIVFTVDLYGLHLSEYLSAVPLFAVFPTLQALVFLFIFIGYLTIIWAVSYPIYQQLYGSTISRRSYVLSNISFAVPVLLPWLVLSGLADLITALPFDAPKAILATTWGQVAYFLVFLIVVALVGPLLIQKSWRCKPLEPGYHRSRIEDLCRRAGLRYANILYWPIFEGRMITAGVMGLVRRFRYILVTDALLELLRPDEIEAVIAHEIGHVKRSHLLFYLFFFVGYMLISYATFDLILYLILYSEPLYRFVFQAGFSQTAVTSTLFTLMTIIIFVVYFRYIFGYFMRNFERQADCYVYSLFENARPLISTFEKIVLSSGQSPDKPNWHHFSIKERVDYLLKCEQDRRWIDRQDRKIRRSIGVYVVCILLVGSVGYALNFGEAGRRLSASFFERIIQREIERNPVDPEPYAILGDFYLNRGSVTAAVEAYERAVALRPEQAHAYNNLAWLYATEEEARNPERALTLALAAAERSQEAHVLDTLAESYYINGFYEEAVEAGRKALALASGNRTHFQEQLERFRAALKAAGGMP